MFTAQDIVKLREKTGAGMMDCKNALKECDGNMEKAMDYLREKGIAKAAKKADRIAAEGLTYVIEKGNDAVILEINSETDFVSKSEDFHNLIAEVAQVLLAKKPESVEVAKELTAELFTNATVKIGEKLSLRRFEVIVKTDNQSFGAYMHMGGKISVLVLLDGKVEALAKDIAMQIAAVNPKCVRREEVDTSDLDKEKEILRAQALNEGKPEAIVDRMVEGRINKYYAEVCLLEQQFVKDSSKTVTDVLKEESAKCGENISIVRFVRYEMGEGLQKKQEDFAEEVRKQTQGA